MDESDGVLRVAVGPSSETDDANSIVTLRAEGDELVEVGRLDGLGAGEDIKAVRWFDDLALVVTFRQIDPLYAVDLTDAADARCSGRARRSPASPTTSTRSAPSGVRRRRLRRPRRAPRPGSSTSPTSPTRASST